ncbi:hypothetical protein R3P38DRAFT_2363695, partial [Favolaschia claudopus]
NYRQGRGKALTPFQKQFKKGRRSLNLDHLVTASIKQNISRWTCSCGQQQYNALLLCK